MPFSRVKYTDISLLHVFPSGTSIQIKQTSCQAAVLNTTIQALNYPSVALTVFFWTKVNHFCLENYITRPCDKRIFTLRRNRRIMSQWHILWWPMINQIRQLISNLVSVTEQAHTSPCLPQETFEWSSISSGHALPASLSAQRCPCQRLQRHGLCSATPGWV